MKKLALALTAAAAFAGQAFAADMPARIAKAPVVAPVMAANWTGFWISGGFGYGMFDYDHSTTNAAGTVVYDPGHDNGGRGWLGKIGAGGDYQIGGTSFVIGAFADAQWSDIKGQANFLCPANGCAGPFQYGGTYKNDWSWAVGARIGYVALPGLLTYWNGGYTQSHWTGLNYTNTDPASAGFGTLTNLALPAVTRDGYFLGGGTEYAISQVPGLFWKSEYRFADYGNRNTNQTCLVAGPCGAAGTIHSVDRSRVYVQTATTELVYRFNWGGPVVAKY